MANSTVPQVVQSYLAQLEKALAGIPADVRDEIVAGIREELDGLDAGAAASRIEALGDPEFIAAEARAEASTSAAPAGATEPVEIRNREPGWYPVLAAFLVAVGGIVVPVVGWVVGLAMVWFSKTWTRAEKLIATLTVPLVILVIVLIAFLGRWFGSGDGAGSGSPNPLIPVAYDLTWSGIVLIGLVNVLVGIWLLWRAKRVWSVPGVPRSTTPATGDPQGSWYPVLTVILIIAGGYLVPVVGWMVGVAMLWGTDVWTRREKWWGTLAGPLVIVAGLVLIVGITLLVRSGADIAGGLAGWHLMLLVGLALPLIANLIVGIHLLRHRAA